MFAWENTISINGQETAKENVCSTDKDKSLSYVKSSS